MNNDLDTLNCTDLKNTYGFNGEEKSNFQLFGIGKPSAKQLAKREKKDVVQQITGCVKPKSPIIGGLLLGGGIQQIALINKYKKDMREYKNCLNNYKAKTEEEAKAKADAQAKAEAEAKIAQEKLKAIEENKALGINTERTAEDSSDDKILGMPKTAFYIGLGVIALMGGVVVYKKFIAK